MGVYYIDVICVLFLAFIAVKRVLVFHHYFSPIFELAIFCTTLDILQCGTLANNILGLSFIDFSLMLGALFGDNIA